MILLQPSLHLIVVPKGQLMMKKKLKKCNG